MAGKRAIKKQKEAVFTKRELLASRRFSENRDLAEAVLSTDKQYSVREAEEAINKFLKGEVKTWH